MSKHFWSDSQVQAIRDRAIVWHGDSFATVGSESGKHGMSVPAYGSIGDSDGSVHWAVPQAEQSGQIRVEQNQPELERRSREAYQAAVIEVERALIDRCAYLETHVLNAGDSDL